MIFIYALLYLIPLLLTLAKGLPFLSDVISNIYYKKVLLFTVKQALLSSFASVALGLPGAFLMAKRDFKFKKTIDSVYRLPFVLPSILVVLGFVIFYGNNGILAHITGFSPKILYTFKAVILAHTFYNFPVVISVVSDSLSSQDYATEEAAKTDGASDLRIFVSITLPRLIPAILSSMSLVFLYCFSSFAIILILGGSPDLSTLEVEIYRLGRISLDTGRAGALALISMLCTSIVIIIWSFLSSKTQVQETGFCKTEKLRHPVIAWLYLTATLLFVLCPVFSVIVRSFFSSSTRGAASVFSLKAYSSINFSLIAETVLIAALSSLFSLALALSFCSKGRKSSIPALLPLATSSVILGLGYFVTGRYLGLVNNRLTVILMHGIINTGFAYKSIESNYFALPQTIIDQGKTDGASRLETLLRIRLPLLRPCLVSAFLFCFVLSCGELNSTLLIGAGEIITIPVAIYRMIGSYNWQGACSLGTVLIVICFSLFKLGEDFRKNPCF